MNTPEASTNCLKRPNEDSVDSLSGFEKKKLKDEIKARKKDMEVITKQLKDNQLQQLIENLDLYQNRKNCIDAQIKLLANKQKNRMLEKEMLQLKIQNFQSKKQQYAIDVEIVDCKDEDLRSKINKLNEKETDLKLKKKQKMRHFHNDKSLTEEHDHEYADLITEHNVDTKSVERMKKEVEAKKEAHDAYILAMAAKLNLDIESTKLAIEKITSEDENDENEGLDEKDIEVKVVTQNASVPNFTNDFDDPEIPFVLSDGSEDKSDENHGQENHRNQEASFSDDLDDLEIQIVASAELINNDDEEAPNREEQEDGDDNNDDADETLADEPCCSNQSSKKAECKKKPKRKPKAKVQTKPQQIHKNSELYNAKLHIKAYFEEFGYTEASDVAKQAVDDIIESVKEKNCSVVKIDQGVSFPENNCRGLKDQLIQLIMAPKVERPKSSASSSKDSSNYVHPLTYTGDLYLDVNTVTGQDVLESAAEFMKTGNNHVFGPPEKEKIRHVLEGDSRVVEAEKTFFEQQSLHSTNGRSHPVPMISKNNEEGLKHLLANASIFMVDDVDEWNGFDVEAFDLDKISEVLKSDSTVQVIRQIPQPTTTNFNFISTEQKSNEIGVYHFTEHHKLEDFLDNHKICIQVLTKDGNLISGLFFLIVFVSAYNEILNNPGNKDEILLTLGAELRKNQLPLGDHEKDTKDAKAMKETVPKYANLLSFGTNVDLSGHATKEQEKSCGKLPDSLAPTGRGSLLNFAFEKIPGLNEIQMYLKPPAARTTGHFESNSLGSININLGPGDCIWFSVPAEYSQSFAQMLNRQRRAKKSVFSQTWWPNEEECIKQGIVVQKFAQRPGQLVYVGIGTYHWVQSEGYTANVSWNVMQPSFHQMAVTAIMNDQYLAYKNYSIVPIEYISWNVVMSLEPVEEKEFRQLLKAILMRSLAHLQATLDFLNKKMESNNVKLLSKKKTGLNPMKFGIDKDAVARCSNCAQVLFNFVPTNKENMIICFKCIDELSIDINKIKVVQCYELDYLASVFDEFQIEQ
ncbi:Protein CBG07453 [Caenorhabditis briggsae]|uniref:Protein CBG07453 n=1 Tax=Caenorhabditis briggsae TaxID=6238 RepID=A8X4Q8_CAEBR|nr:Protein CBG07453 [Caenorhabditis briggsae]CAP27618.2 Protein CBG07453 [Caenorhabditis briggsae]